MPIFIQGGSSGKKTLNKLFTYGTRNQDSRLAATFDLGAVYKIKKIILTVAGPQSVDINLVDEITSPAYTKLGNYTYNPSGILIYDDCGAVKYSFRRLEATLFNNQYGFSVIAVNIEYYI